MKKKESLVSLPTRFSAAGIFVLFKFWFWPFAGFDFCDGIVGLAECFSLFLFWVLEFW
jgi:hypothetical protein